MPAIDGRKQHQEATGISRCSNLLMDNQSKCKQCKEATARSDARKQSQESKEAINWSSEPQESKAGINRSKQRQQSMAGSNTRKQQELADAAI
jgi:hypothetical protein